MAVQKFRNRSVIRAQELCESRGGRPGLPVPNKPTVSVDVKQHLKKNVKNTELRSCTKVEVAVLGPSLISLRVSVNVKQLERRSAIFRA